MEAFSLLKYWRGNGGGGGGGVGGGVGVVAGDAGFNTRSTAGTTTIVTAAVTNQENETDEEEDVGNDDDGPFFDLEFAVPDEDVDGEIDGIHQCQDIVVNGVEEEEEEDGDDVESTGSDDGDGESEFKFTLSSGSNDGRTDQNLALSPSDDLFFKGTLVPIEPSSLVLNSSSEQNSKAQFPVSLLKSATKFRVFMLGLKKSKSATSTTAAAEKTESNRSVSASASTSPKQQLQQKQESEPKQQQSQQESKFFTVKFKVEEVPIVSLFTRDTSRSASSNNSNKLLKQNSEESAAAAAAAAAASSEEKRFSKEVVQKYLKKVKPLYIRVSKRYGEKLRFSGQLSLNSAAKTVPPQPSSATQKSSPATAKSAAMQTEPEGDAKATEAPANNVKSQKQVNLNLPAGLRVVRKHLGKSRSASSAVAAAPSTGPVSSRRRDDSLLQQQDGIQSAILHCKRSFNASRDSENLVISRCASDSSNEKSTDVSRSCAEKVKKEARVKSSS